MRWSLFKKLSRKLSGSLTGSTVRKEPTVNEGKVCQVWPVLECEYFTEAPEIGLYMPEVWKNECKTAAWRKVRCFLKKAVMFTARLSGAAALTCLYSMKAIESAFQHRGYVAYGGEYLMIPFVFYGVFKVLGIVGALCYWMVRKQKTNKKENENTEHLLSGWRMKQENASLQNILRRLKRRTIRNDFGKKH